jgi:nucleotide-binding universal stress UspA family protein
MTNNKDRSRFVKNQARLEPVFQKQSGHSLESNRITLNVRRRSEGEDQHGAAMIGDVGPAADCEPRAGAAGKPVVLVPLDFSPASIQAANYGIKIARDSHGLLLLVHAVHLNLTPYGPANLTWLTAGLCREAMTKAEPILIRAQEAGVTAICAIEKGAPAMVIANVAKRWAAKVIVLGIPKRGMLGRLFGEGIVKKVKHAAECPVIVLKTDYKERVL